MLARTKTHEVPAWIQQPWFPEQLEMVDPWHVSPRVRCTTQDTLRCQQNLNTLLCSNLHRRTPVSGERGQPCVGGFTSGFTRGLKPQSLPAGAPIEYLLLDPAPALDEFDTYVLRGASGGLSGEVDHHAVPQDRQRDVPEIVQIGHRPSI